MINQKTVILFSDWFEPGYKAGGPIRSVTNLANRIGAYHNVFVVTSNKDFNEEKPYQGIVSNSWIQKDWGKVIYLDDSFLNAEKINEILQEVNPDFVHLNSFFSPKFSLLPLKLAKKQGIQVVLAPRGMLGSGALAIKKLKKKVFLSLVKLKGLYKGVIWHASTEMEAKEIRAVFGDQVTIKVALNLVHLDLKSREDILNNRKEEVFRFVYLARVSPIKNLFFALECLSELRFTGQVDFDIYGPIEDVAYWEECQRMIEKIGHVNISYQGELPHDQVSTTLMGYNCLFLPTRNENFGHVFLEAWSSGCQTLISDNTPWHNLKSKGVGASISLLEQAKFIAMIESMLIGYKNGESVKSIASCLDFAQEIIENKEHLNANLNLFTND